MADRGSRIERNPWAREVDNFARAFSGAYIFGVPLLFTMEMWWIGEHLDRRKLFAFLALAFVANLGLSYIAGFRYERIDRRRSLRAAMDQAIDTVAVGIAAATIMLLVLNRLDLSGPLDRALGMIAIQAVPLSIGAAVANEVFGRPGERHRMGADVTADMGQVEGLVSDVGATIIGGLFVGFSITPTDEVPMIAAGLEAAHMLALVGFSLLVSYTIVFLSEFDTPRPKGLFQGPVTEMVLTYLVSLGVAVIALYLFDQIEITDPLTLTHQQTLVLGVPTTVGGAAGRLIV